MAINTKTMSFWSCLSNMYQVSWAVKITPKPKTMDNSSRKRPENVKNNKFLVMPLKHVLSVMGHVNPPPITPKQRAIAHKNGHTRKNDEFLVMPVKHVLSVMGLENRPRNPKLWTIAHETAQKCKNDRFLVIPLKHLVSVMGLVNHLENPK
jgi:hypothetical protein